jgi:RNA polymerase sigma-70 factor (ECF subfamily)
MITAERDEAADQTRRFEQDILIYAAEIYRVALRLTRRPADAEDLVQETCLRAFRSLSQLRHPGAAKVWLFTILRSVFLRQIERGPAEHKRASLDDVECWRQASRQAWREAGGEPGAWSHMLRHDTREAVRKLPHPYQEAVVLAHVGGFTYQEMARILGVPIGTVMSRLFRGRQLLRAFLEVPSVHSRTGLPAG